MSADVAGYTTLTSEAWELLATLRPARGVLAHHG